jgi:hypothetical protein
MSEKILAAFKILFNRHKQRGFSMLETAIVVPAVLMFTLGTIDVANYLRSYHTAKQAATEGVRCLYPTDSGCTSVSPAITIPQNNLYIPPFFSNMFDYDGLEKRLLLPNYSYGSIRATVLDQVWFQADVRNWRADKPWFNGAGTAKILSYEVPTVSGHSNLRLATMSDGYSFDGATSQGALGSYKECRNLPTIGRDELGDPYGSARFRVPNREDVINDPHLNLIQYCKNVIGDRKDTRNISCDVKDLRNAKLYFKLNGAAANSLLNNQTTNTRAAAHLNIQYSYSTNGGSTWSAPQKLGGQEFSTEESANFYPRGFNREEMRGSGYNIDLSYGTHGIIAPWGSLVRVQVYISKPTERDSNGVPYVCPSNQKISWSLTNADLRLAKPEVLSLPQTACAGRMTKTQCNEQQCQKGGAVTFGQNIGTTDYDIFDPSCGAAQGILASVNASCITQSNVGIELKRDSDYTTNFNDYDQPLDLGRGQCSSNLRTDCPSNFGAITYDQKVAACPATDAIPGSETWSEKPIELLPAGQIQLNAQNCQFNPSDVLPDELIPQNLKSYVKLILPTATQNGHTQMDTADQDPSELKQDPLYACSAVTTEQREFNENAQQYFTPEEWQRLLASSFNGPVQQMNCSGSDNLRAQAISIGMSNLSYYETTKALQIPNTEYLVNLNQIDSCMIVREDGSLATTNLRSKVPGGPFDEGVIPSQCIIQGQNKCISIPAGVRQVETSGQGQIDKALVIRKAQAAANAFLPNACPDCVQIDPNNRLQQTISEQQMIDDPLELEVNVKQPLLVLAGREVNVSYTASRYWEGRYSSR